MDIVEKAIEELESWSEHPHEETYHIEFDHEGYNVTIKAENTDKVLSKQTWSTPMEVERTINIQSVTVYNESGFEEPEIEDKIYWTLEGEEIVLT